MGMYNEVFCPCPVCDGQGYMQIPQIVLGFGGFRINDPESLARELSVEQLHELKTSIVDRNFVCRECRITFNPFCDDKEKLDVARELFTIKDRESG